MDHATQRTVTGIGAVMAGLGLAAAGVVGPAAAVTPSVTATCETVDIALADYSTIPATAGSTQHVLVTEAVDAVAAVYGPKPVTTAAQEAVPAVYSGEERKYIKHNPQTGEQVDVRWFAHGTPNDSSVWTATGETRPILISEAVPAVPEVLGEAPLITAEVPAQAAVYEDRIIPATPGDDSPNTVSLYVDGDLLFADDFGADYTNSVGIDGTADHTYSVVIQTPGADDSSIDGSTVACVIIPTPVEEETPPVLPPVDVPPVLPPVDVPPVDVPPVPDVDTEPVVDIDPVVPTVPVVVVVPAVPVVVVVPVVPAVPVVVAVPVVPPAVVVAVVPVPATAVVPTAVSAAVPQLVALPETGTPSWSIPALFLSLAAVLVGVAMRVSRRTGRA